MTKNIFAGRADFLVSKLSLSETALNAAYIQGLKALSSAVAEGRDVSFVTFKWGQLVRASHPLL